MYKVLIVNDDGINSKETKKLHQILLEKGNNTICVTPNKNCSGYSGMVSLNQNIKIELVEEKKYMVMGSPVDALVAGVHLFNKEGETPNLIISGVNKGLNYGNTLVFSGTYMAALVGLNYTPQSIAISYEDHGNDKELLYKIVLEFITVLKKIKFEECVININLKLEKEKKLILLSEKEIINSNYILILPKQIDDTTLSFRVSQSDEIINSSFVSIGIYHKINGYKLRKTHVIKYNLLFKHMSQFLKKIGD